MIQAKLWQILTSYKITKACDKGGNVWCWPCTGDGGVNDFAGVVNTWTPQPNARAPRISRDLFPLSRRLPPPPAAADGMALLGHISYARTDGSGRPANDPALFFDAMDIDGEEYVYDTYIREVVLPDANGKLPEPVGTVGVLEIKEDEDRLKGGGEEIVSSSQIQMNILLRYEYKVNAWTRDKLDSNLSQACTSQ